METFDGGHDFARSTKRNCSVTLGLRFEMSKGDGFRESRHERDAVEFRLDTELRMPPDGGPSFRNKKERHAELCELTVTSSKNGYAALLPENTATVATQQVCSMVMIV